MAFEGLSEKLNATFKRLRGKGRLTEADVREGMREVRMALLEADVSYKVVKDFVASVTEKCVGADVLDSLTPAQQIIKIVNEELTALMGGTNARLTMASKGPTVVMMVGLQGAGKTTNGAKLAGLTRRHHPAAGGGQAAGYPRVRDGADRPRDHRQGGHQVRGRPRQRYGVSGYRRPSPHR